MSGVRLDESPPRGLLSVVVTVVAGGEAVASLLDALANQVDPPAMEILVPYDDSVPEVGELARRFPAARFLSLGQLRTAAPIATAAGQHELYDRRRSAALRVASGELVAIVEDRGIPRPDWARTAVTLHQAPWAVIGGAIEPSTTTRLGWALHVCDFSRYGLPFESRAVEWVSDVNVVYKRRAIDSTRQIWQDRFHEPLVHWDLMKRGETLYLANSLVVDHHRPPSTLGRALAERFHWGRLFGHIRAREVGAGRRFALIAASPLIPLVVLSRHCRTQARQGRGARVLRAVPLLSLLLGAWTAGEVWGYVTRRP